METDSQLAIVPMVTIGLVENKSKYRSNARKIFIPYHSLGKGDWVKGIQDKYWIGGNQVNLYFKRNEWY